MNGALNMKTANSPKNFVDEFTSPPYSYLGCRKAASTTSSSLAVILQGVGSQQGAFGPSVPYLTSHLDYQGLLHPW
jgi:hypothetical protein